VDTAKSKSEDSLRIMKCKFCAASHDGANCPAYGVTCYKCNGRNHFARCCFISKNGTEERSVRHMEVEEHESNELLEGLYIEEIQGSARRNIQSGRQTDRHLYLAIKLRVVSSGAKSNLLSTGALSTKIHYLHGQYYIKGTTTSI